MRAFGLVAVAVLLTACNRPNWETPVSAYTSFSRAVEKRDINTAWNALSPQTKKILEERSKEIHVASDGGVVNSPKIAFFSGPQTAPAVKEITVVRQEGNEATLSVVPQEGPATEVRMVRDDTGAWKIDLSDKLAQ